MPLFRPTHALFQTKQAIRSPLAARIASIDHKSTASLSILASCPAPTCSCRDTPAGLDIDHKTPIANNVAAYSSHLVVSTGQADWPSRIEDSAASSELPWAKLTSDLKSAFGRHGRYHSATENTLITASSFRPLGGDAESGRTILHFPSFQQYSMTTTDSTLSLRDSKGGGGKPKADSVDEDLELLLRHLTAGTNSVEPLPSSITVAKISSPTILICTHNSRDTRCGILGPLLQAEFEAQISQHSSPVSISPTATDPLVTPKIQQPTVAGVSHVGGHKWAGNVIVYIPPDWTSNSGDSTTAASTDKQNLSSLAGHAIWYGRVTPSHVEGILNSTLYGGSIIQDLCRGVMDFSSSTGKMVRI